jgi:hypothetical protein
MANVHTVLIPDDGRKTETCSKFIYLYIKLLNNVNIKDLVSYIFSSVWFYGC